MRIKLFFCMISFAVILGAALPEGHAQDTSTYLMGYFQRNQSTHTEGSEYYIFNPTTRTIDVIAAFYREDGTLWQCARGTAVPRYVFRFHSPYYSVFGPDKGTVKFFAFPQGSKKLEPNVVIGGFHRYIWCQWVDSTDGTVPVSGYKPFVADMNLAAVPINSSTIDEFKKVLEHECTDFDLFGPDLIQCDFRF